MQLRQGELAGYYDATPDVGTRAKEGDSKLINAN
jgi:hypothetical protein